MLLGFGAYILWPNLRVLSEPYCKTIGGVTVHNLVEPAAS